MLDQRLDVIGRSSRVIGRQCSGEPRRDAIFRMSMWAIKSRWKRPSQSALSSFLMAPGQPIKNQQRILNRLCGKKPMVHVTQHDSMLESGDKDEK